MSHHHVHLASGETEAQKTKPLAQSEKWLTQVLNLCVGMPAPTLSPSVWGPPPGREPGLRGPASALDSGVGYPTLYGFGLSSLRPWKLRSHSLSLWGPGNKLQSLRNK